MTNFEMCQLFVNFEQNCFTYAEPAFTLSTHQNKIVIALDGFYFHSKLETCDKKNTCVTGSDLFALSTILKAVYEADSVDPRHIVYGKCLRDVHCPWLLVPSHYAYRWSQLHDRMHV